MTKTEKRVSADGFTAKEKPRVFTLTAFSLIVANKLTIYLMGDYRNGCGLFFRKLMN
jgi:hypothetical protein